MSGRLVKKILKEQETVLQEQPLDSEDESESPESSFAARNPFDLLEDDDDDASARHSDSDEEVETTNETLSSSAPSKLLSKENVSANSNLVSNATSKKNKKKKKKKNTKDSSSNSKDDLRSSDLMFKNLTLGSSASSSQQTSSSPSKLETVKTDSDEIIQNKRGGSSILQVDPKHLSAENELRRIFGSKVVKSFETSQSSANSRMMRGGRRGGHNIKRTILVSPPEHWPRWDGCLSMEHLETKKGVHYFRYVHSSSYAHAQRAFESAKAIHDLNGIASILLNYPYHIDSLITLADYFKFTGEHQMSADAIGKCLYAMECAWHPLFTPSQNCLLEYVHDSNKPFFSVLFNHMKNMDRRGCHRSALEICKLLLSFDPEDPMGALFCIDYYALRAEEYAWLEQFAEEYRSDNSLWLFPNFSYSLAVSRFYLERNEQSSKNTTNIGKASSSDLMKQALMLHPSVLKKLVAKVPLKDRVWNGILKNRLFASDQTKSPSLDHLIAIYVERSYLIWRLPDLQKLLTDSALMVIDTLKEQGGDADDWACVRRESFSSEKNEYRHLLVSEFSDSVPTMPPENLQDFVIDPRMGFDNQRENVRNVAENHIVPRELNNRNALAVLIESVLPWIHYGTEEEGMPEIED